MRWHNGVKTINNEFFDGYKSMSRLGESHLYELLTILRLKRFYFTGFFDKWCTNYVFNVLYLKYSDSSEMQSGS